METIPSPELVRKILNAIASTTVRQEEIDADLFDIIKGIPIPKLTVIEIGTIHLRMRQNNDSISLIMSDNNYNFQYDTLFLAKLSEICSSSSKILNERSYDIISVYVLVNYIAWEILYENENRAPQTEPLVSALLLSRKSKRNNSLVETLTEQVFISFIAKDTELLIYDLIPDFLKFSQIYRCQSLFLQILKHMSRDQNNPNFKKFLNDFILILEFNSTYFSEKSIFSIIQYLLNLFAQLDHTALRFLKKAIKSIEFKSDKCANLMIPMLPPSIMAKLKYNSKPIEIELSDKQVDTFPFAGSTKSELDFSETQTLPNGFDPSFSINFPTVLDLSTFFDADMRKSLSYIAKIVHCLDQISFLVENFFEIINKNQKDKHIYNFYCTMLFICNKFEHLQLSTETSKKFFQQFVFNISDTVFDFVDVKSILQCSNNSHLNAEGGNEQGLYHTYSSNCFNSPKSCICTCNCKENDDNSVQNTSLSILNNEYEKSNVNDNSIDASDDNNIDDNNIDENNNNNNNNNNNFSDNKNIQKSCCNNCFCDCKGQQQKMNNYSLLNTLRSFSLDFLLADYGDAINDVLSSEIIFSPLFIAEFFARLSKVSSLFASKIETNVKLIKTITSLTLYYQHLEITNNSLNSNSYFNNHSNSYSSLYNKVSYYSNNSYSTEFNSSKISIEKNGELFSPAEIEQREKEREIERKGNIIRIARVSIFATLAHLFADVKTLQRFYDNSLFINSFSVFLFEEPVRHFVKSTLTTYLINIDLSLNDDIILIFDHILRNLVLQLPGYRQICLLNDMISLLVEGLVYHQKGIEKFSQTCTSLCQAMALLSNDDISRKTYEMCINLLGIMSPYFEISALEIEALISRLISFNDANFIEGLYTKFVALLAGQIVTPSSPNFVIRQPQVLKLLLQTYSQVEDLDKIISFVSELCKFSIKNLSICTKSDIDLVILNYIEKEKRNKEWPNQEYVQKFLNFYSLISFRYSTAQSVLRYISLLSPLDDINISKYQLQFIETMNNIIINASEEPRSTFPLRNRIKERSRKNSISFDNSINNNCYLKNKHLKDNYKIIIDDNQISDSFALNGGFSFTFWVYIEPNISDYRPKICSIKFTDNLEVGVFISNCSLFIYQFEDDTEVTALVCDALTEQKWHFVVLHFTLDARRTFVYSSVDCGAKAMMTTPALNPETFSQKLKCTLKLGGTFKTRMSDFNNGNDYNNSYSYDSLIYRKTKNNSNEVNDSALPSKLASFGFYKNVKVDDLIQICGLGLRNNNLNNILKIQIDPVHYVNDFTDYDDNPPTGFTDVLVEQCGVNILIPLFLQIGKKIDFSEEDFTLNLESIITLLTNILMYSIKAQISFSQSKGFNIIAEILTEKWIKNFTFKNYQQLFKLLLSIQCEQLQQQLFDEVMTNFTFLMMLDDDLHLRILKHWSQSLFPSFKLIAINFSSFEDLISVLRLFYYYQPIEIMKVKYVEIRSKSLNIFECRKYILNLLFEYASDSFDFDMFSCIVAHCISCTELKQVQELVELLIKIFSELTNSVSFDVGNEVLVHLVQYYMRYPCEEIRILVLKLLIVLHNSSPIQLIEDDFLQQQLDIIICIIPKETITKSLLCFLVSELMNEPLLMNLCCYLAAYLNDASFFKEIFKSNYNNNDYPENFNNNPYSNDGNCWKNFVSKSKFWGIGPLALAIYVDPEITDTILLSCKENLADLVIQYDLFIPTRSEEFEERVAKFIVNRESTDIPNPFEVSQRLIAFSREKNISLFCSTDFDVYKNSVHIPSFTPKNQSNVSFYNISDCTPSIDEIQKLEDENKYAQKGEFIKHLFSNSNFLKEEKPNIYFNLKFNQNHEWIHKDLAEVVCKKFESNFIPSFLAFDLLLCSFLATITSNSEKENEFDIFDHLCSIYLNDRVLNDCDHILSYLEYHTVCYGKRRFLRNQPFANPFPTAAKFDTFLTQINPKNYINKLHTLFENFKGYQVLIKNLSEKMSKIDISMFIEMSTKQMTQFLERQDFQNDLNIESWRRLWSALSIERAPWYTKNSINSYNIIWQRESSACFALAPVKMIKKSNQKLQQQLIPMNSGNNNNNNNSNELHKGRGIITSSLCNVVSVIGKVNAVFYLFEKYIKIRILKGKTFEIANNSITHIFLRKNKGIHFFAETGFSFHLEFHMNDDNNIMNENMPGRGEDSEEIISKIISFFNHNASSEKSNKQSFYKINKSILIQNNLFLNNKSFFSILPFQNRWRIGKMSNYEYLLMLNHCSGRSFNDLHNYPFFPYVLNDFSSTENYRDFSKNNYRHSSNDSSYPVNKENVLTYLRMIEPFKSDPSIRKYNESDQNNDLINDINNDKIENNIGNNVRNNINDDDKAKKENNVFFSVDDFLHYSMANNTEIVPEFYSMPELFSSSNFALPMWSNTPIDFIYFHRKVLESPTISKSLHIWITKIFGENSNLTLFDGVHPQKENSDKLSIMQKLIEIPTQLKNAKGKNKNSYFDDTNNNNQQQNIEGEKVICSLINEIKPMVFNFLFLLNSGKLLEVSANLRIMSSSSAMPYTSTISNNPSTMTLTKPTTRIKLSAFSVNGNEDEYNSLTRKTRIKSNPDLEKLALEDRIQKQSNQTLTYANTTTNPFGCYTEAYLLNKTIHIPENSIVLACNSNSNNNFKDNSNFINNSNSNNNKFIFCSERVVIYEINSSSLNSSLFENNDDSKNDNSISSSGSFDQKRFEVETDSLFLNSLASDGNWIVVGGDSAALISIIRGNNVVQSIHLFRDSLACIGISQNFNLVACGTRDGSLVICSASSGDLVRVISLSKYSKETNKANKKKKMQNNNNSDDENNNCPNKIKKPLNITKNVEIFLKKVLITSSWGFIVACADEITSGVLKHFIFVFSVNGIFIRKTEIAFGIDFWFSFASNSGFDFLVYTNEAGHVFVVEVFMIKQTQSIYNGRAKVVAARQSEDETTLAVVTCDGRIAFVPISL